MELGLGIIQSTEDQQRKIKSDYENCLKKCEIPDPNEIPEDKRKDDITKWPDITTGTIFSYILKKKDFDADYIGKYKDQKAYSFFDSGFVGPIMHYEPSSKKQIIFLYCNVRAG